MNIFTKIKNWFNTKSKELGITEPKIIFASYDKKKEIMTVKWDDETSAQYKGTGIVWRRMPMLNRASLDNEEKLDDILKYIEQWNGDYPNAHKQQNKQQ